MDRLGPFEAEPHLAVGVSGGADSMALALLADHWVRGHGGRVTALTVDHALRKSSASEAEQVAAWCQKRGIAHRILQRTGPAPRTGIQAAARTARYTLLGDWCHANDVLHLLVAHHRDDQAETLLHRFGRGSTAAGLAAMPAVSEQTHYRLLRPLLDVDPAALTATLQEFGQDWIEDPSNIDTQYARTRLRTFTRRLADDGLTTADLAAAAAANGAMRESMETAVADLLAATVTLFAEGYCTVESAHFADISASLTRAALARMIVTIAGRDHSPRGNGLSRLTEELQTGRLSAASTLGGCRVLPITRNRALICREPAAARQCLPVSAGVELVWDRRFTLALPLSQPIEGGSTIIARLGRAGLSEIAADRPALRPQVIPAAVRPSLPALWRDGKVLSVPHLNYRNNRLKAASPALDMLAFTPAHPLAGARFGVA